MKIIPNSILGDIMFVNTNLWYHSTYVLEGLSLSLGDEYASPDAMPPEGGYMIGKEIVGATHNFFSTLLVNK